MIFAAPNRDPRADSKRIEDAYDELTLIQATVANLAAASWQAIERQFRLSIEILQVRDVDPDSLLAVGPVTQLAEMARRSLDNLSLSMFVPRAARRVAVPAGAVD